MSDTPPEIKKMVHDRLMARSAEERFIMGAQMFIAARTMALASFPSGLSAVEIRHRLFERLYGKKLAQIPGYRN